MAVPRKPPAEVQRHRRQGGQFPDGTRGGERARTEIGGGEWGAHGTADRQVAPRRHDWLRGRLLQEGGKSLQGRVLGLQAKQLRKIKP